MFDLVTLSMHDALKFNPDAAFAMISITSEEDVDFPDLPNRLGLLRLHFYDEDRYTEHRPPMSYLQAAKAWSFIHRYYRQVEIIALHCLAGYSRSPAMAAAIDEALDIYGDNRWFRDYSPNMHVYRTMLNTIKFYDEVIEGFIKKGIDLKAEGIATNIFFHQSPSTMKGAIANGTA